MHPSAEDFDEKLLMSHPSGCLRVEDEGHVKVGR